MSTTIGIGELKKQASHVVHAVREEMAEYVITVRNKPVAVLRPLTESDEQRSRQDKVTAGLEEYFDFLSPDDIRVKGTRIGIETVLDDYLEGISPEEIAARYRSLALEQVYATLLYYFRNRTEVDVYLEAWRTYTEQAWLEQQRNPSPITRRLRELRARRAGIQGKMAAP